MKTHLRRGFLLSLSVIYCTLLLVGCGGGAGGSGGGGTNPDPTATISAAPASVPSGTASTLTWTSTHGTSASIDNGVGTVKLSDSATVTPTQTTTYTLTVTGSGGKTATATATVTVTAPVPPTATISASPTSIKAGQSSTLTVTATAANSVVISNNIDSTTYTLPLTGGTQSVSPRATTIYTVTVAGGENKTATATATVTLIPGSLNASVNHIIFMMQENRTFDHYFGMLNPYRSMNGFNVGDNGVTYNVDGIDDKLSITNPTDQGQAIGLFKLRSTCIDDDSSSWLPSYGDISRFNYAATRPITMDGFVHTAAGYNNFCAMPSSGCTGGVFTDILGERAMGYYDQDYLNYYYYIASQFALSDRWFSPVAGESIPNRFATMTGGTTQGLVHDPGNNEDKLPQLAIQTIFQKLDSAHPAVSWKIYYSTTQDQCAADPDGDCGNGNPVNKFPASTFTYFTYSVSQRYLYLKSMQRPTCVAPSQDSGTAVGDPNNAFCIDTTHIAPVTQFTTDMANGTLPAFSWVEAGYSRNDEHPGSGQSILLGQAQVASLINAFMASPSWQDSIFFLSYDEGGGPYDHVPPIPNHTNDKTTPAVVSDYPVDVASISVAPDAFAPCIPSTVDNTATLHCDLRTSPPSGNRDPGTDPADAAAISGFAAQIGFRLPNFVVSPFTRKHYVSHIPMDHTAVIKLVETRFISPNAALTARDAAQPDLLDFFDFTGVPWQTPPSNVPTPFPVSQAGPTCTAASMR